MTYVGRGVDAISNVEKLDNITFDGSTTYNLTKSSVAFTPSGANNILISIDGVVQQGNFSIANQTIVFDWSPTSSNTCNWIQHYGTGVLNVPADGAVSTAKIAADAVTGAKIADDQINSEHYVDGSIDTAHIADDQITLAKMASGTDGNIISYDASGNPVAIATGSDGQVLTSTGAGSPPAFEAVPSTSFNGIDDTSSSNDDCVTITDNEVVINEDGDNQDFRVESDDQANFFFCDASANIAGFSKHDRPDMGFVHITSASSGVSSVDGDADELVIENSASAGISILTGTSNEGSIKFGDSGDNNIGLIKYDHTENAFTLFANAQISNPNLELLNNQSTVVVGQSGGYSQTSEGVKLARNENFMCVDSSGVLNLNREGTDGLIMSFFADNTAEGNITSSGTTIQFNTFCGSHWGRLADNSQPTILRGTVIETIATMIDWYRVKFIIPEKRNDEGVVIRKRNESAYEEIALPDGKSVGDAIEHTHNGDKCDGVIEKQDNEQLPMTKISDTEDSKAVYGVFSNWDNEPDDGVNDMNVAALGAFIIRVHKDETVAIGDLLSSKGDGTAKVQADDIMRSKTIAKVTSTNKTYTYDDGSYCVPCTLHCG